MGTFHWEYVFPMEKVDDAGYVIDRYYWQKLIAELIRAASLQHDVLAQTISHEDAFSTYAELYDSVNGERNFEYISQEIQFIRDTYQLDFSTAQILSIGCGTGIMEEYFLKAFNLNKDHLLGIDVSEGMVKVASKRINARVEDILNVVPERNRWDICLCTANVLQYLPQPQLEKAIQNIAHITQIGGYFIGDFITSDHPIRAYPNVLHSEKVFLLRSPLIVEKAHNIFQQTKLINVSQLQGEFRITYEGEHTRYLPSLWKLRYLFQKYFTHVEFFDAMTLEPLEAENDTSPSTRYLVFAQKKD
ncbi:3-demethylubiquinone-9 3-methyltransferase [Beggiatoa sp. PS]|nr:3-demethylubiquinone-9 3-methyltransferase [Beggiatoa sp. PS]